MKRWSVFREVSVRIKLLLLFLLFSIVPVLSLALLSYENTVRTIERDEISSSEQMVRQAADSISELRRNYDRICYSIKGDTELIKEINGMDGSFDVDTYLRIRERLDNMLVARRNEIGSLFLYSPHTREFRAGNALATAILNYGQSQTYYNTMKANGDPVWGSQCENPLDFKTGDFLSVSMRLGGPSADQYGGQVLLLVRESAFDELYSTYLQGKLGLLYIVDRHGRAISHPDKTMLGREMFPGMVGKALEKETGYYFDGRGHDRRLVVYRTLDKSNQWKLIRTIRYESIFERTKQVRNLTLLLMLLYVFMCAAAAYIIASRATRPIEHIASEVERATEFMLESSIREMERQGDSAESQASVFDKPGGDEFKRIAQNTTRLLQRLQNVIEEMYKEKLLKREAELKSLQTQIDPHFLYNSLEHIKSLALLEDASRAADQISALGKLFRINLARGSDVVAVANEVEHVRLFSMFYEGGSDGRVALSVDLGTHWMENVCLRMVLQPIVENAYLHAFDGVTHAGRVTIREELLEGTPCLCVIDDGQGMSQDRLAQVRAQLAHSTFAAEGKGVALSNVHQRLRLRFGAAYGLEIESEAGVGTRVYVRLPNCPLDEWRNEHETADR